MQVQLPLCFGKHHPMETYGGVEVQIQTMLTSARDEGEWSVSRLGRFNPRMHCVGRWVGHSGRPTSLYTVDALTELTL
jgi:hypothetical protein